jgi:hypothetical protein
VAGDRAAYEAERKEQAGLLRDLLGDPFSPVCIDASWLTWDAGTGVRVARSIYEERRWEDMPILGDVLEEAGCSDEGILSHCRGKGPTSGAVWLLTPCWACREGVARVR